MTELLAVTTAVATLGTLDLAPAAAAPALAAVAGSRGHPAAADPATVAPGQRDRVLPANWRTSTDLAWTMAGDPTGLHLLVAESRTGYTWRTAATLSEPGFDTDRWIGNACLTASGARAVVVYAPRQFTNRTALFGRGGFAAVVDLASGRVTKLGVGVSLAYYNPGCGAAETAVLTQSGAADLGRTRLHLLDTVSGRMIGRHELPGQLTSAVPLGGRIAAATGGRLVVIDADGTQRTLAQTRGVAFDVRPDRDGGIAFLEHRSETTGAVRYVNGRAVKELGSGPLDQLSLAAGISGQVFVAGSPAGGAALPPTLHRVAAPAHAEISTLGRLAVTHAGASKPSAQSGSAQGADPESPKPVDLRATVLSSGHALDFAVDPAGRVARLSAQGSQPAPVLRSKDSAVAPFQAQAVGSATDPVDADRTCSVQRNDPRSQVEQPHWRQVEWAADLAVQGALTVQRPANWKQSGLPAWSPQGMFPPVPLAGGGRVPAQVMLGILAQESNLWQASWHALEGVTGNPLIGNFYGLDLFDGDPSDDWVIRWSQADCGYGVAQVTDGMRLAGKEKPGEVALPPVQQRTIALDYASNIAAGLRILQQKWNQIYADIKVNNADPSRIENWFAAVWAYNTGLNPQATTGNTRGCTPGPDCTDAPGNGPGGNWGLGWGNNPANPDYPYNRNPFLLNNPDDARHPQDWPYPEKVMGFAAAPIVKTDFRTGVFDGGYLQAWWTTDAFRRSAIKPPLSTFCTSLNNCSLDVSGKGSCGYANFHCWWHWPAVWKPGCQLQAATGAVEACGFESLRFNPGAAEPPGGTHYPPVCTSDGLPAGSLIVDDQPDTVPVVRDNCPGTRSQGSFAMTFSTNGLGLFPSKIDLHQIGSGLDGHFWFAHELTQSFAAANALKIEGTWTLDRALVQWARVFVHLPNHGAHAQQATYTVDRGASATPADTRFKTRTLLQRREANVWVPLGVFQFDGTPRVTLSNVARNSDDPGKDANGTEDVAWDAVAFQLLPAKPRNFIVTMGESYSSGEGASEDARIDYYPETDNNGGNALRNGCHRSRWAWSRQAFLMGDTLHTIGQRADAQDPDVDYHLLACSGAQTENLLPTTGNDPATGLPWKNEWGQQGTGSYREGSQLDKGYLDENTTLVTFSVGGNDVQWGKVLQQCIIVPSPGGVPCMELDIDGVRMADYIPLVINREMRLSVLTVLRAVHQKAPNARIILMGYPELLENDGACLQALGYGILPSEATWINQQGRNMALALADAVTIAMQAGIPVRLADPISNGDFAGQAVCGNPETLHKVIDFKTAGEDPNAPISQQSFHPKISGAANYAKTFNREMRNFGL